MFSTLHSNSCLELLKYFGTNAVEQILAVSGHEEVLLSNIQNLVPSDNMPLCYECVKRSLSISVSSIYFSVRQKLLHLASGEIQFYNPYVLSVLLSSLSAFCISTSKTFSIFDETITISLQNILKYRHAEELISYVGAEELPMTLRSIFEDVFAESYNSLLQVSVRVLYNFVQHQIGFSSGVISAATLRILISEMSLSLDFLKRDDEEKMKTNSFKTILKQCDELGVLCKDDDVVAPEDASLTVKKRFHLEDYIETLFHTAHLLSRAFTQSIPKDIEDFIGSLLDFVIWSPQNGTKVSELFLSILYFISNTYNTYLHIRVIPNTVHLL